MSANRKIQLAKDITFLGSLNHNRTAHIAISKADSNVKYIAKALYIGPDYPQKKSMVQGGLRKLYGNNQVNLVKPEVYGFDDQNMYAYFFHPVFNVSLQQIIIHHKKTNKPIQPALVYNLACKLYDIIVKMKKSGMDFFHRNLKPSNIFYQLSKDEEQQIQWRITQCGIITNYPNRFYQKQLQGDIINNKSNLSFTKDHSEGDLYSLGVILLEMITLAPIQKIFKNLQSERTFETLQQLRKNRDLYGPELIDFIHQLLQPRQNLKQVFHKYKQYPPEYSPPSSYTQIAWNYQKFENFMNSRLFEQITATMKKSIVDRNIKCEQIIHYAQKFDPQLNFYFTQSQQLEMFLLNYDVNLNLTEQQKQRKQALPFQKLYQLCFYLESVSSYNYMEIVKNAISTKQIIQAVTKKGIQNYKNRRQFFEAQTNMREFWKADDIYRFLSSLGIFLNQKDVNEVVKQWASLSGAKRSSVRYQQFSKVFKECGRQGLTSSRSRTNKTVNPDKTLKQLLLDIKQKIPNQNLVSFFRSFDTKAKWVVDQSIQKQLKKYATTSDKSFKQLMDDMWQSPASINSGKKKILKYIDLLKNKKIYQPAQLFRYILTQKINQSNREQIYKKYEKDDKGWTYLSLMDFNSDQGLDFDERQLKILFAEIDQDNSQYLCEKQLIYQLTGLKQFDLELIVEKVKNKIQQKRINIFNQFVQKDQVKSLCLGTPGDLAAVFIDIGLELPVNHYEQLFNKYQRGQKFDYLLFLRYFYELSDLFVQTCRVVIEQYYNGNFEKFFAVGLTHGRRKWNRNSLVKINSDVVLCFSENQIGEIWKDFDKTGDGSLTRGQIAEIFKCNYDKNQDEQDLLPINSTQKFMPADYTQKKHMKSQKSQKYTQQPSFRKKNDNDQTELIKNIKKKDIFEIARFFIKKSRYIGALSIDDFCQVLIEVGVPHMRNMVIKQTSKFQYIDPQSKSTKINFVSFLMFICQDSEKSDQQNQQEIQDKTQILFIVLRQIIKNDDITTQQIFSKCRDKTKMKLTDYENFVKDTLKIQIYFDDIEQTWKYFGDVKYIQPKDLEKVLNSRSLPVEKKPSLSKQISFKPTQDPIRESGGRKQSFDEAQSPHFPRHMKSRRSSRDSKQLDMGKKIQKRQIAPNQSKWKQQKKQQTRSIPPKSSARQIQQKQPVQKSNRQNRYQNKKQANKQMSSKTISKEQALKKFTYILQDSGTDKINQLFMKANIVSTQKFVNFLINSYNFQEQMAIKIGESISSFGKIKIEAVRKYLPKKKNSQTNSPVKQLKQVQTDRRNTSNKKNTNKQLTPQKGAKSKVLDPNTKLIDPRKTKLNIPLIKQHIRILINCFAKKFSVDKMQHFYFEGNNTITEDTFIQKCQQINSSISQTMYKKIFLYLKPAGNSITSISFKINFNFDQQIQYDESYLPQQLETQIKAIFDKADKDKSGYIQIGQIQVLLSSLGLNETQKQIENYFEKIDQNFDKKISYPEFRIFLQENIIPYLSDFDEESDKLYELLKMNDIFRTGLISVPILGGVLQKYGVKVNQSELVILSRFLGNQNGEIKIDDLISALYFPSQPKFSPALKSVLYRIRWKKKITFKDIQKIFEAISSCFVISYTEDVMKKRILTPSAFITPILNESLLFYQDYYYKNPISNLSLTSPNLRSTPQQSDVIVQLRLLEATGLPIPQSNSIKNTILSRSANITFYDTSSQQAKHCITTLHQIQFDSDIEDLWTFSKNFKSVFIKFGQYDMRKYEKMLILIEFIVTISSNEKDGNKPLSISCGSCSIPVKQLLGIDGKIMRKYKVSGGIPNKSKDIDKMSVSKRKGWRGFIKNEVDSQLNVEIMTSAKFTDKIPLLAAMPQKSIVNRKSLDYLWTFRQFFALKSADNKRINPDYKFHFLVKTFLLCLDIPDIAQIAPILWKQTIESKIKSFSDRISIFMKLLNELFFVIHSKQFQLLPSYPSKSSLINKSLRSLRQKLIMDVFSNIQNWVSSGINKQFKRKKQYNCEYQPFIIQQKQISIQAKTIAQKIYRRG